MKKFGFTLAEIVIVIACVGVLAAIMLGSLDGLQPDKEKVMFKKAYQITERAVGELVNDESIYPYDPEAFGFYNKEKALVEGTDIEYEGDLKFCCFFARKLNVYEDPDVCKPVAPAAKIDPTLLAVVNFHEAAPADPADPADPAAPADPADPADPATPVTPARYTDAEDPEEPRCVFQTTDSVSWVVGSGFDKGSKSFVKIRVDVNGAEEHNGKAPNSRADSPNRDVYDIFVDFDGRVRVEGNREIEFLRSHTPNKR